MEIRVSFLVAALLVQNLFAVDGTKLFEYSFGKPLQTAPAVDHDGTIFVGGQGSVAAVSPSGAQKWKIALTPNSTAVIGGLTVASDRIYVTSSQGLYAYTKSGTSLWSTNWDTVNSSVALGQGEDNYVLDMNTNLWAFREDGSVSWQKFLGQEQPSPPFFFLRPGPVVGEDGTIYSALSEMSAVDSSGALKWVAGVFSTVPPTPHEDGHIYRLIDDATGSTTVEELTLNGTTNWTKVLKGPARAPVVIGPDGTLFVATLPNFFNELDGLVALDRNGEKKWSFPVGALAAPAVASDGSVFVASGGKIFALTENGAVKWTYTNSVEAVKGLSIGIDNSIYVSQEDGMLLALRGSFPLPDKGWPILGKDHRHSSQQRIAVDFHPLIADQITTNSARITAELNPQGSELTLFFEYSSDSATNRTFGHFLEATNAFVQVSADLADLSEGTLYRARMIVSNEFSFVSGNEIFFQTAGTPSPVVPSLQALQAAAEIGATLQFSADGLIEVSSPIEFTTNAVLDANGHAVVLSGNGISSMIRLATNIQLSLRGLTFINGRARGFDSPTDPASGEGGAIVNLGGALNLVGCTFSNNIAIGAPNPPSDNVSVPFLPVFGPAASAAGGAIWQSGGTLRSEGSTFVSNSAIGSAASPGAAEGGAIFLSEGAMAHLTNNTFIGNGAQSRENGFRNFGEGSQGDGGAIYARNSDIHLVASSFSSNQTSVGIGLARGGALYLTNGLLTLTNSTFTSNQAFGGGQGDIVNWFGLPAYGGAIYNDGTAKIHSSTFSYNSTIGGRGQLDSGLSLGGAIYNNASLEIVNSTLNGNSSPTGYYDLSDNNYDVPGGASAVYSATPIGITNSTIAYNTWGYDTLSSETAAITLKNTILAFNSQQNGGTNLIDAGHNLSSDATPAFSDPTSRNNLDPLLGALATYGGPTPVFSLIEGSPAIDAADDAAAPPLDQRGRSRPFGTHADIGSFESSDPYYIWGKIIGYRDPTTVISIGETNFSLALDGTYLLGPFSPGSYQAGFSSENAHFRPNPWTFNLTADTSLSEVKSFEIHTFTFDGTPADPVFTLAGLPGEVYHIDASLDLQTWSPLDIFTIDQTGLLSILVTNNAPTLYLRPFQQP